MSAARLPRTAQASASGRRLLTKKEGSSMQSSRSKKEFEDVTAFEEANQRIFLENKLKMNDLDAQTQLLVSKWMTEQIELQMQINSLLANSSA